MVEEGAPKNAWFALLKRPHIQAGLALVALLFFVVLGLVMRAGGGEPGSNWGYQSAATSMMLFGVGNALMSLGAKNVGAYWMRSFLSYILLVGIGLLVAWLYSGLWITEAGSYRWIYMVLTFGYLVLLSIVSMMRGIVQFAEREEWSQPRQRDRE